MELDIAKTGLVISILTAVFSVVGIVFVYKQVVLAAKTTRSALLSDLVGIVHFDSNSQDVLDYIYRDALTFSHGPSNIHGAITSLPDANSMTNAVDQFLCRLQMIGHLYYVGTLKRIDLRGIRFEIIMVGRNLAIREYFRFLNAEFQQVSGVSHDHFRFFKKLYLAFEYDHERINSFQDCLFELPSHIKE